MIRDADFLEIIQDVEPSQLVDEPVLLCLKGYILTLIGNITVVIPSH